MVRKPKHTKDHSIFKLHNGYLAIGVMALIIGFIASKTDLNPNPASADVPDSQTLTEATRVPKQQISSTLSRVLGVHWLTIIMTAVGAIAIFIGIVLWSKRTKLEKANIKVPINPPVDRLGRMVETKPAEIVSNTANPGVPITAATHIKSAKKSDVKNVPVATDSTVPTASNKQIKVIVG